MVHLEDIPKPTPKDHEVLVKVHAATVAAGDVRMRKPDPVAARLYNGLFRPRKVTVLDSSSPVMWWLPAAMRSASRRAIRSSPSPDSTLAPTRNTAAFRRAGTVKTGLIAHKPSRITYAQAAAVPVGGLTALAFLRKGHVQPGHAVLVYGASGSVGTYAIQLAKYFWYAPPASAAARTRIWSDRSAQIGWWTTQRRISP